MQEDSQPARTRILDQAEEGLSSQGLAKLLFFGAAAASLLVSVYLFFSGDRERGIFVGLWVPSILSAGGLVLGGRDDG